VSLVTFAQEALIDFQRTASIVPSSRYLVQAMIEPLPLKNAKVVVELGPGTGVMTRELLHRIPPDATLLAFEINPRFTAYLRNEFKDPRLKILETGAENAPRELRALGIDKVDASLSSLACSMLPAPLVHEVLNGLLPFLGVNSVFTQYQYVQQISIQRFKIQRYRVNELLSRYFRKVGRSMVWRNMPPALVFDCQK